MEESFLGAEKCCSLGLPEGFLSASWASWGLPEGFPLTGVCASTEEGFLGDENLAVSFSGLVTLPPAWWTVSWAVSTNTLLATISLTARVSEEALSATDVADVLTYWHADDQTPNSLKGLLLGEVAVVVAQPYNVFCCLEPWTEAAPQVVHGDVLVREPGACIWSTSTCGLSHLIPAWGPWATRPFPQGPWCWCRGSGCQVLVCLASRKSWTILRPC